MAAILHPNRPTPKQTTHEPVAAVRDGHDDGLTPARNRTPAKHLHAEHFDFSQHCRRHPVVFKIDPPEPDMGVGSAADAGGSRLLTLVRRASTIDYGHTPSHPRTWSTVDKCVLPGHFQCPDSYAVASIVIEPCLIASYNPESKSHCRCGPTLSCWRSVPTRSSSHEVTSSSRLYSLSSLSDCVDGSR